MDLIRPRVFFFLFGRLLERFPSVSYFVLFNDSRSFLRFFNLLYKRLP